MATAAKVAGLPVLPSNFKVVSIEGKQFAQKKTRSRRRFKLSKSKRAKISAAAKKFKIPVLTIGANIVPIVGGVSWLTDKGTGLASTAKPMQKAVALWNTTLRYYTGVSLIGGAFANDPVRFGSFSFGDALIGLGPNVLLGAVKGARMFMSQRNSLSKATGGLISAT